MNSFHIPIFVWVLSPQLETQDANLEYYYDFNQSIQEYKKVFAELGIGWKWQPINLLNYQKIIDSIVGTKNGVSQVVLNLCDGDEVNGTPGISVVKYLQETGMPYTGAEEFFYYATTSKITMKQYFDAENVSTAIWLGVNSIDSIPENIFETLGSPIIVKPAVSGGSLGLGTKNVVHNFAELQEVVQEIYKGYHGWDLAFGGIILEPFIFGPEYTTLIVGDYNLESEAIIYNPVERLFHSSLKEEEKFLSFDRLWETYDNEKPIGDYEDFYNYKLSDSALLNEIKKLSWQAYESVKGTGYGRVDIRMDKNTNRLYVLEVNAQCGLSEDENYTSIGAILRFNQSTFTELIKNIINIALHKKKSTNTMQTEYQSIKPSNQVLL